MNNATNFHRAFGVYGICIENNHILVIDKIKFYKGEPLKKEKEVLDATVLEFIKEPPTFEITLKEPVKAQLLYGFSKTVSRVHLNVDEERKFYDAVKEKLKHE